MITSLQKERLRRKAAQAMTWQERRKLQEQEAKEKAVAYRIRQELEAFSERCHAYALTPEGQARAEELRDAEYDKQVSEYQWRQHLEY